MPWDPAQYNQFKKERYLPFDDLLTLIAVKPAMSVIDLGCGTGELTRRLADLLPGSEVTGIDSSPQMLQEAASYARPGLQFRMRTIEAEAEDPATYDLVFSNAAIQWVDNHEWLLPRLMKKINKGGQLAIQLPSNHDHYTHVRLRELAATEPFASATGGWTRHIPVLRIEEYARLLFENGGTHIRVFEKVYPHVMPDVSALVEWVSGTALIPYLERLPGALKGRFREEYLGLLEQDERSAVKAANRSTDQAPIGTRNRASIMTPPQSVVFYPFKRTLLAAQR